MTYRKDDGGPFHPSGKGTDTTSMYGASFRAVAAMHAMAALIIRSGWSVEKCATLGVRAADALIAEMKK